MSSQMAARCSASLALVCLAAACSEPSAQAGRPEQAGKPEQHAEPGTPLSLLSLSEADRSELSRLEQELATSRRQLQRAFAEAGDSTFRECLTRIRMRRASELLATESMTVREVARRVGYRQPAQFAKAFRREHGLAPSAFRADAQQAIPARLPAAIPALGTPVVQPA